ncbi:MAG: hypothetical protein K1X92_10720 [Bacteroidia bacterium]|nr:hypothetical protein [Bacteroidia bacterium]
MLLIRRVLPVAPTMYIVEQELCGNIKRDTGGGARLSYRREQGIRERVKVFPNPFFVWPEKLVTFAPNSKYSHEYTHTKRMAGLPTD